jgi:hypothetical protein
VRGKGDERVAFTPLRGWEAIISRTTGVSSSLDGGPLRRWITASMTLSKPMSLLKIDPWSSALPRLFSGFPHLSAEQIKAANSRNEHTKLNLKLPTLSERLCKPLQREVLI